MAMFVCVSESKALRRVLGVSAVLLLVLVPLTCPAKARADTPAQVQKAIQAVCDRASASVTRRDLAGFMAMYASGFKGSTVSGWKVDFRQVQAGSANTLAESNCRYVSHCMVSPVMLVGNQARTVLRWHYVEHHGRSASAPAYMYVRDDVEQTVWKKLPSGWHQTSSQVLRDVNDYRR